MIINTPNNYHNLKPNQPIFNNSGINFQLFNDLGNEVIFHGAKIRKISEEEKAHFKSSLFDSNNDTHSENNKIRYFIDHYGSCILPHYVVEVGSYTFYFSKKLIRNSGRSRIVGFLKKNNGKFEINFYWRSISEGYRRFAPEIANNSGTISKAQQIKNASYETTTKLIYPLNVLFNDYIDISASRPKHNYGPLDFYHSLHEWNKLDKYSKISSMENEVENVKVLSETAPNSAVNYYQNKDLNSVVNNYNNFSFKTHPELLANMKLIGISYSSNHPILGKILTKTCETKYEGEDVVLFFSYVENDPQKKVWIDGAYFKNKVTSQGVYKKQLNIGPIAAKPIDYRDQCPLQYQNDPKYNSLTITKKNGYLINAEQYMDIRDLYQGCPIIKRFKQLSNL